MKTLTLAALTLTLMGGVATAQPRDDHHGAPGGARPPVSHGPSNAAPHAAPANRGPAMHAGPAMTNHAAPVAMRGRPQGNSGGSGRHRLPPGIAAPTAHHGAPMWRGRSFAVGDIFVLNGFTGPTIDSWNSYALPPPRRGTHWIYVDGYYLMVGNRTGHIFAEVPADY